MVLFFDILFDLDETKTNSRNIHSYLEYVFLKHMIIIVFSWLLNKMCLCCIIFSWSLERIVVLLYYVILLYRTNCVLCCVMMSWQQTSSWLFLGNRFDLLSCHVRSLRWDSDKFKRKHKLNLSLCLRDMTFLCCFDQ